MPDNSSRKGCFPCDSVVTVDGQKKPYKDLKVGDLAKVVLDDGNIGYSEVWCISHHNPDTEAEYIQVDTESKRLVISKRHFVSVKVNGQLTARMAEELKDKDGNGCFPGCGNSIVDIDGEKKYIEDVRVGDKALAVLDDGSVGFSKVWCLAHKDPEMETTFIKIDTETKRVTLSPKHFIAVKEGGKMKDKMAKDVAVGDVLYVLNGKEVSYEPVVHIEEVDGKGVFAPFTESGRIVVSGILCSCYAEFPPAAAHAALSVHRQVYDKTPTRVFDVLMTPNENGVPIMFDAGYRVFKPLFTE